MAHHILMITTYTLGTLFLSTQSLAQSLAQTTSSFSPSSSSSSPISQPTSPSTNSHVFVLSGGGSPAGNNYSQYLQTKLLTDELRLIVGHTPDEPRVDVRFGAGNDGQRPPQLFDVRRSVQKDDGRSYTVTLPGHIAGNDAATKAQVEAVFAESLAARVQADDTFFLFVTDHGMPNAGDQDFANNCIDLWAFDADSLSMRSWDERCLSVTELRQLIKTNIPAKKTVFAMSQCFSGGFHKMSVKTDSGYPTADTSLCGFTAITEDSTASGCTPDVDGPGYKGYERSLAQQLTGRNVVTGEPMPYQKQPTLRAAHIAAALEDTAKDIPTSTSDFYLTTWARTIESETFVPRTKALAQDEFLALYREALDAAAEANFEESTLLRRAGPLRTSITERRRYLAGTISLITNYDPELTAIVGKPMRDIDAYLANLAAEQKQLEAEADVLAEESTKLWLDYGITPWHQALAAGQLTYLSDLQKNDFELAFMRDIEAAGRGVTSPAVFRMALWSVSAPEKADALSDYLSKRGGLRWKWLEANSSADALAQLLRSDELETAYNEKWERIGKLEERHDQLRRVMFTRRQIAAAVALAAARDEEAISTLKGLEACEATRF